MDSLYGFPPLASLTAGECNLKSEQHSQTWIITGERGAGKSVFCDRLAEKCRASGLQVGGVISTAVFENGTKTGISLKDISSGRSRLLGSRAAQPGLTLDVGCWHFDPVVLDWGNQCLSAARGSQVLILDECGILEFGQGGGLVEGMRLIDQGEFDFGLVVIRPELLPSALKRWPDAKVYSIGGDL